jgi:hypothetical protein
MCLKGNGPPAFSCLPKWGSEKLYSPDVEAIYSIAFLEDSGLLRLKYRSLILYFWFMTHVPSEATKTQWPTI